MKFFSGFRREVVNILKAGGIGVIPTDTIYGLVGSARNPEAIARIYLTKGRDQKKPLIILVSSLMQAQEFGITVTGKDREKLEELWPGPNSVIFKSAAPEYLTRGHETLAFRLPDNKELIKLIHKTGPLVAPSANPEGETPPKTIEDAVKYFKEKVDFYVDGGKLENEPSALLRIIDGEVEKLR